MQEPNFNLDAIEADDAVLDGATSGVAAGHGVLASMLSWIRGALGRGPSQSRLVAGVPTAELPHVDPKAVVHPERFDPALLMGALIRYGQRYERQLHGAGLLLGIGQQLPPAAFPITEGLARFGGPLDTDSYRIEDYEDRDAAIRAIETFRFTGDKSNGQLGWLVNAAMLRAAVSMACFVYAKPRLELGAPHDKHVLAFDHQGKTTYVNIDSSSSPLSLHRHVRLAIQGIWRTSLAAETARVSREFVAALRDQGLPAALVETIQLELDDVLQGFKPLLKMRHSSDAFINISAIAKACTDFAERVDRLAARNALRHSTQGLQWANYLVHLDSGFKAEIAEHEPAGALAYANYSPRLLEALCSTNGTDRTVHSLSLGPASGGLGTIWGGSSAEVAYTGHLTRRFMKSLNENVSPEVRRAFSVVSPRYLCVVAGGHPMTPSFEKHLGQQQAASADQGVAARLADTAGRRLAAALNQVAAATDSGRNILPWTRVLSSSSCYELLMTSADSDERAVTGLVNLISYANALRAKGARANDEVRSLPDAEDCMSAPGGNAVASLMGMRGATVSRSWNQYEKAALHLVRDLVASVEPVTTQHIESDGASSRALKWVPELAVVRSASVHEKDLAGGFRLALRNPGTRKGGTWTLLDVTARKGDDSNPVREFRIDAESNSFAVRGKGTPEGVAPLVMEVRMQEPTRFRAMANRKVGPQGWSPLEMQDISGCGLTNPHMATRISEADRHAIPRMNVHASSAMAHWAARLGTMLARQPFHSAAAFPAVARFLWSGGRTADDQTIRQVSVATAFKLARACLGSTNPYGMGLLCRYVTRPEHRTASGVSLLDIALDSTDYRVAQGALEGLRKNSKLAQESGGLAGLVQASIGKLIERHPELIPMALKLGAKADETALLAWSHLHPQRRSPHLEASINEAVMRGVIEREDLARAEAPQPEAAKTQPSAAARPRRRVGAI